MKKEGILVTGATGFIGTKVVAALEKQGKEVVAIGSRDCDITDLKQVLYLYQKSEAKGIRLTHVIHLAGVIAVSKSWDEPEYFFRVNTTGTLNILELCRQYGLSMTYISAYIYGQPERLPIKENSKVKPNNPYAQSKYMAEELCRFYSTNYKVKTSIIRPFNIYGPGQTTDFLIPLIIYQMKYEEEISVMDLVPKRDYVFVEDLADAIIKAVDKECYGEVINIGSGKSYSVAEVIEILQRLVGDKKLVTSKNRVRKNEMNDVVADIENAKQILNWEPTTSFEEGLKITLGI